MTDTDPKKEPRGLRVPPTLIILAIILAIASIAAQVVPPGTYERTQKVIRKAGTTNVEYTVKQGDTIPSIIKQVGDDATEPGKILDKATQKPAADLAPGMVLMVPVHPTETRTVVVPGSFKSATREGFDHPLKAVSHIVSQALTAPLRGFVNKADIIAFILLIGGAFGVIIATGAIDLSLHYAVDRLARTGAVYLIIPALMVLFSAGGAIFGMSEEVIPFVMITVPLALRLGYDSITGLCISFVAAGLGFAGAFFNPFTVQIAQGISDLPPVSGFGLRFVVWVSVTIFGVVYTMWWAQRVKKNPKLSPTWEHDQVLIHKFQGRTGESRIGKSEILVLLTLVGAVALISWGVVAKGWYLNELSGIFVGAAILSAVFGKLSMEKAAAAFMRGASELAPASLVVAMSAGILIVMQDGQILDTLLNTIAGWLAGTHAVVAACLMFVFQSILNFFLVSGSGQAAMTMPIMAPLSDVVGVTRQTAVLAYQFGDGFGNMIIPTSAVTMSVLGIAEIPWEKWAKWILPMEILLLVFGFVFLAIAVMTGYS